MRPADFSATDTETVTGWRHDLHRQPELGFDTHQTSAFVEKKLREFGCDEVVTGLGRTGVVGVIKGRETGSGRVTGLRADMDALPITEATGLPWASQVPGKMHACGHDGHSSMLLGATRQLCRRREFDGTAVVVFQPAEEGGGGGREMVADGLMERFGIDQIFGLHNMPGKPAGNFSIRPGPLMACSDNFEIEITGRGGHAAWPHACIDTTLVASHIIIALQSVVARAADPLSPLVLSVTQVQSDSNAYNVIPERVKLCGTVRALDPGLQDLAEEQIDRISTATAQAFGATASTRYSRFYPVTVNTPEAARFAASVATSVTGAERVDADTPPIMGAEDFSYMLQARPGAMIFLGNGDSAALHHPEYDFNDAIIPAGIAWWAGVTEQAMPLSAS